MKTCFKQGTLVYLTNGQRAEYVAMVDGNHLVRPAYMVPGSYDEPDYEEFDKVTIVDSVYAKAPVEAIDSEIVKRRDELIQVQTAIREAREEISRVRTESKALIEESKKLDALRNIEDFLADRITHFVVIGSYGNVVKILDKEAALKDNERTYGDRKLLSLYGNRKDGGVNLSWHINRYSDGSGSTEQVICCTSREEAVDEATKILKDMFAKVKADRPWDLGNPIQCSKAIGIPVPAEFQTRYDAMLVESARKQVADAEAKLATEKAKLAALTPAVAA